MVVTKIPLLSLVCRRSEHWALPRGPYRQDWLAPMSPTSVRAGELQKSGGEHTVSQAPSETHRHLTIATHASIPPCPASWESQCEQLLQQNGACQENKDERTWLQ